KYIIFLTDGLPTVGKTDEGKIIAASVKDNTAKARLFALGVGYDVNVRLIDKLVAENQGLSDYVKPGEPLEAKVSNMYAKIKNPVMTDIQISLAGVKLKQIYPRVIPDLFDGSELLVVGRYDASDVQELPKGSTVCKTTLVITGKYQGQERGFEYPVAIRPGARTRMYNFVERLWAVRRVGFLLDEIQLHGKNEEVIDEIVRLSRDYGIMTPYTSFLADEDTKLTSTEELRVRGMRSSRRLSREVAGPMGQTHAMNRLMLNQAERGPAQSRAVAVDKAGRPLRAAGLSGLGYKTKDAYEAGELEVYTTVRNVGNQAFYRRGRVWVTPKTSKLDLKKDKDKIRIIQRYSKEYFELALANTVE
ncbi:MAG: hypothetical protein KAT11_08680, partial [Phycisphaerae bacterium]|nr:hypothetical protein [Phycisphaerae bacterium]